ncbi:CopD family protein [Acuticoccus sp. MNP-M23]|uniref:copper resistance D family protein n=1 Tax=Acuticoccus sp. MNP-M23 TaxID=3072793 RepID=UPI002815F9D7|nr:CopD family protein [Acuticoccus sp. MNP-M23]WMS43486.1 CopD family protein [Acuticoccus sp. MNP-M23]
MSEIGAFTILAIAVRALGYAGSLLAAGSGLFLLAWGTRTYHGTEPSAVDRVMRRTALLGAVAAVATIVATLLGLGMRAGRLSGMGLSGMTDGVMLQIVWEGAVGTAVASRIAGLAAIVVGLAAFRHWPGAVLIGIGALATAVSYTFVGHATEAPRLLLAFVLTLHLLMASLWFGSFAPLIGATRNFARADAAALLEAFGRSAVWGVAVLVGAGGIFAAALIRSPAGLLQSAYGQIILVKLGVVAMLLGLAALNKFRLVPALASGREGARTEIVRSVRMEAAAITIILIVTATLTSVATPPVRMDAADSSQETARPPEEPARSSALLRRDSSR